MNSNKAAEMELDKKVVLFFRIALLAAILVTSYLTTTSAEYSLAEKVSDKLSHVLAFLLLAFLADFSFPCSGFDAKKYCLLMSYGVLIECIQYFLPYRSFSILDMLADALGLITYACAVPLLLHLPILKKRWSDAVSNRSDSLS